VKKTKYTKIHHLTPQGLRIKWIWELDADSYLDSHKLFAGEQSMEEDKLNLFSTGVYQNSALQTLIKNQVEDDD